MWYDEKGTLSLLNIYYLKYTQQDFKQSKKCELSATADGEGYFRLEGSFLPKFSS